MGELRRIVCQKKYLLAVFVLLIANLFLFQYYQMDNLQALRDKETRQDTQITESNTENASTDTSAPTNENVDTPQTSDSNNVYIYVACIIFALTGVIKYGKMKKVY